MIRPTLSAALALTLAGAPLAAAQTPPPAAAPARVAEPGSAEWLQQRADIYEQSPDAGQDPAELAATARLNAEIAARLAAAEEEEAAARAAFEADNARWREESARLETERVQWEANASAANAARAQWERDNAAWAARMEACRRSGRVCIASPPPPPGP
ncbi:MAG: hypothetical protein SWI22_02485 [Pseudomonadota bacterium]|nr:hypothetical protein [Pseudomonadota bacterium]